jgi:exosortase/archaeosortase family protein
VKAQHRGLVRAWLIFLGALAIFRAIVDSLGDHVWDAVDEATAQMTAACLRTIGIRAFVDGTRVTSTLFTFEIIRECSAVHVLAIYLAAVAAYPCRIRAKLVGAGVGIPAIIAINQVRLVGLQFVGHYFPDAFETAHLIAGQGLVIFAVLVLWMLWAVWVAQGMPASAPSRSNG